MEIYEVRFAGKGDSEYYSSLDKALTKLWEEYKDTYFENEDDEEREGAYYSLTHESCIDGVGEIYEIEVK